MTRTIDELKAMGVAPMDFSKVFDEVLHGRLIQKIQMHGIQSEMVIWIQKWLTHRGQRVVLEGYYSGWR